MSQALNTISSFIEDIKKAKHPKSWVVNFPAIALPFLKDILSYEGKLTHEGDKATYHINIPVYTLSLIQEILQKLQDIHAPYKTYFIDVDTVHIHEFVTEGNYAYATQYTEKVNLEQMYLDTIYGKRGDAVLKKLRKVLDLQLPIADLSVLNHNVFLHTMEN